MDTTIITLFSIMVFLFMYFITIGLIRMDFKEHPKLSLVDVLGSTFGLILSSVCLGVYCAPSILYTTKMSLVVCTFSFFVPLFGVLSAFNGFSFNIQRMENIIVDKGLKIASIIVGVIGIILSIIVGRIL
jgi:hypothetical protein